ncbi:MAG TPA: GNAT family N-acetyltransferase [Rectinemataceae bacterium]|nr:GNAT family N-acetyltransferase [Rectinemataceae bacterium]
MNFRLEPFGAGNKADFLKYCARHGREHDESFIPGAEFAGKREQPSFILRDERGAIVAALSLMLSPSMIASGRIRVAILHASLNDIAGKRQAYGALLSAAARAVRAADPTPPKHSLSLFLFLPSGLPFLGEFLLESGFVMERIACAMRRDDMDCGEPGFPQGFRVRALLRTDKHALFDFVTVRNRNFREVTGSADSRVEDWLERLGDDEALEGGAMLLIDPAGEACGTAYSERDEEEGSMYIGALSLDRGYRHRGLGRALMRSAIRFGADKGFRSARLSVNASNNSALALYMAEGFVIEKAMDCLVADPEALARIEVNRAWDRPPHGPPGSYFPRERSREGL